jgi:hypothetical protein
VPGSAHHLSVINRVLALIASAFIAGCASPPSATSPTPVPTTVVTTGTAAPAASPRAAQALLRGDVITATGEREMVNFFADRGSLLARATRDGLPPYLSRIQRAERSTGVWSTLFENDAMFMLETVAAGRMAFVEYREQPLSGGAHDMTVVVLDLRTVKTQIVDHFALSAATFRGGGGGPRRAVGGLISLGPNSIAWTHQSELQGGVVEAELRVASFADLSRARVIGRSREWIEPISIDDRELVYVVGGTEKDELRVRDLDSGSERTVAELRAPSQSAGRDGPVISGAWAGWIEHPPMAGAPDAKPGAPSTTTLRAVNLQTGEVRERVLGADYCSRLTANASYFVWDCGVRGVTQQAFDTRSWAVRDVLAVGSTGSAALAAVDGGFVWYEAFAGTQRVSLLTTAE